MAVAPKAKLVMNVPGLKLVTQSKPGPFEQTRWVIMGSFKSGKSTTAASFPGTVVIDFEDKLQFVPDQFLTGLGFVVPSSLKSVEDFVTWLDAEKKRLGDKFPVKMVAFDTMTSWMRMAEHDLTMKHIKPEERATGKTIKDFGAGGGKGSKGWDLLTNTPLNVLQAVKMLGIGWIVTVHLKETTITRVENGKPVEVQALVPMLNPGLRDQLFATAEFLTKVVLTYDHVPAKVDAETGRRTPPSKSLVCTMEINAKPGDSADRTGSNVTMPSEIKLELGKAGAQIKAAYNAATGRTD